MKAIAAQQDLKARTERDEALSAKVRKILESSDWENQLGVLLNVFSFDKREWRVIQKAVYQHLHGDNAVRGAVALKKRIAEINPKLLLSQLTEKNFAPLRQRQPSPAEFFKKHHGVGHMHAKAVALLVKNYVISGQFEELIELDHQNQMMKAAVNRGVEAGLQHELESRRTDLFAQKFVRLAQPGGLPNFLTRLSSGLVQRGLDMIAEDTDKSFFVDRLQPGTLVPEKSYLTQVWQIVEADANLRHLTAKPAALRVRKAVLCPEL